MLLNGLTKTSGKKNDLTEQVLTILSCFSHIFLELTSTARIPAQLQSYSLEVCPDQGELQRRDLQKLHVLRMSSQ